jgi:hypothetical protein
MIELASVVIGLLHNASSKRESKFPERLAG